MIPLCFLNGWFKDGLLLGPIYVIVLYSRLVRVSTRRRHSPTIFIVDQSAKNVSIFQLNLPLHSRACCYFTSLAVLDKGDTYMLIARGVSYVGGKLVLSSHLEYRVPFYIFLNYVESP